MREYPRCLAPRSQIKRPMSLLLAEMAEEEMGAH